MKKLLIALLGLISSAAFAHEGIYLGAGTGLVYNGLDSSNNYTPTYQVLKNKNNQVAGRLFLGYDINKYLGVEAGYLLTTNLTINDVDQGELAAKFKVKEQIADLMAKGRFYAGDSLFIFGEAGLAYINVKDTVKTTYTGFKNGENSNINVVYGAGIGYDISQSWSAEAVYTRYNGSRDASYDILNGKFRPTLGFYSINISYKF